MMTFNRFLAAGLAALIVILAGSEAAWSDEIAPSDFRISHMGPDGETTYVGGSSDVAYNSANDEFFVVWLGNDDVDAEGTAEVFGQRLDAKTGELLGARIRLSDMGEVESDTTAGFNNPPDVTYDSQDNQYLVVWSGDDVGRDFGGINPIADGEREVYGQRVDAATGAEIGVNDFRISVTGTDGDSAPSAIRPAVAYNSANNEYLVAWGDFDSGHPAGESFGRRFNASNGSPLETQKVLRVPDPANEKLGNTIEMDPPQTDVAYNAIDNEYLVVFRCDCFGEAPPSLQNGPGLEIFGQRLDASAAGIGVELQLSDMGVIGDIPKVTFNSHDGEYLVVWQGYDSTDNFVEIYGQRLNASGGEIGTNDFRISFMGPDGGDTLFEGSSPDLAYNSRNDEYLVVWHGDHDQGGQVNDDMEIFSQRVEGGFGAPGGDLIGTNVRLSDMRGIGSAAGSTQNPAVDYSSADNISLVVWSGDDDVPPLVAGEFEVFGQLVTDPKCGNGVADVGEVCDDGNADETDACLDTCVAASCGDGFVQAGVEDCDGTDDCADDCTLISAGTTGGSTGDGGTGGTTTAGNDSPGGGCSLIH